MRIHGMSSGLNYGQQILEGFKAFRMPGTPGGVALFRPDRNSRRFRHSSEVLGMPSVPMEMFVQACRAVVALNAGYVPPHESNGGLYVRPQLYGSSACIVPGAAQEYRFCVFVLPTSMPFGTRAQKALFIDNFDRAAPRGTGHAKVGGNYAPVVRYSEMAKNEGFSLTLHQDPVWHENVEEFGTCAFIGVRSGGQGGGDDDDVILVIPDSPCIIDSVTSESIQDIARRNKWKVEKRPIPYAELPEFSEVLGAGTGVTLVPIRSITRRRVTQQWHSSERLLLNENSETIQYIPDERPSGGPVYLKLLAQLRAIQVGEIPDEFGWRFEVRSEDRDLDSWNQVFRQA
jgi:branched-chain amino acid aminotransferase